MHLWNVKKGFVTTFWLAEKHIEQRFLKRWCTLKTSWLLAPLPFHVGGLKFFVEVFHWKWTTPSNLVKMQDVFFFFRSTLTYCTYVRITQYIESSTSERWKRTRVDKDTIFTCISGWMAKKRRIKLTVIAVVSLPCGIINENRLCML